MAKQFAYGNKKTEKKPSRFRSAFLKATLGSLLVYGSYQHYTPEPVKDTVKDAVTSVWSVGSAAAGESPAAGQLTFVFENQNQPAILGAETKGVFFSHTNIMDEWYAASGRHAQLLQNPDNRKVFEKWLSQLDHLKRGTTAEKATGVDALIDKQITYVLDNDNYGPEEYWASPMETLQRGKGDCEDFAILKYHALRYLGVPADKMFVVAVSDKGASQLDHATLMVDIRQPGSLTSVWESVKEKFSNKPAEAKFVILDNDGSEAGRLLESKSSTYKPYYAMNEKGVWGVPANSGLKW